MTKLSQKGQSFQYSALVIGSGISGLMYCLELIKNRPSVKIALVCKMALGYSNSSWAQGGIASVHAATDSFTRHIKDTLQAGDGRCYEPAVEGIINAAPDAIQTLADYGVFFDDLNGAPDLVREGGHSEARIFHFGDYTGAHVIEKLVALVRQSSQIDIFDNHVAIDLIKSPMNYLPKHISEILGCYVLDETKAVVHTFLAQCVVLATGGAGKVYRYTSNTEVATGDGIAMAYRAGARVASMEFYQFHPTLLYHSEHNNFLISEVVRGEGAYLRLPATHERFMQKYAPDKMELATRDIVARAIFSEIENHQENFVYLDIRHQSKAFVEQRFPMIYKQLHAMGIDMSRDLIPVVPAAHYLCGGILTNTSGVTDLPRLYAIGENAFTGLHGANRLASNSLLEGLVMAKKAAIDSLTSIDHQEQLPHDSIPAWDSQGIIDKRRASQINAHWRGLRGEMTSYAGIVRTEAGLKDVLQLISARRKMIEESYRQNAIVRDLIELRNISLVAELIVKSALLRKESCGCHFREDYPNKAAASRQLLLNINEPYTRLML